jgi:hypothetical protein
MVHELLLFVEPRSMNGILGAYVPDVRPLPVNRRVSRVGDAGIEAATSAV